MDLNEVITTMTPSLLFSSASTSSLGHLPSSDHDESPPLVVRPCGACKVLRRRCVATCILALYFPLIQPLKFLAVHRVFGVSNVFKFLQGLPESQRADTVDSMVYEATTRIRDPVYGCAGVIFNLQKLINDLQMELDIAKSQLSNHDMVGNERSSTVHVATTFIERLHIWCYSSYLPDLRELLRGQLIPSFRCHRF